MERRGGVLDGVELVRLYNVIECAFSFNVGDDRERESIFVIAEEFHEILSLPKKNRTSLFDQILVDDRLQRQQTVMLSFTFDFDRTGKGRVIVCMLVLRYNDLEMQRRFSTCSNNTITLLKQLASHMGTKEARGSRNKHKRWSGYSWHW